MIKQLLTFCLYVLLYNQSINAQVVFWAEDFNNGCTSNCLAGSYSGPNGSWTVASTGTNGNVANEFFISCAENGMPAGKSAVQDVGTTLRCMLAACHVSFASPVRMAIVVQCTMQALLFWANPVTNKRAESPLISTVGKSNITLEFNYIEQGSGHYG